MKTKPVQIQRNSCSGISTQSHNHLASAPRLIGIPTVRAISMEYPHAVRHDKHSPFAGYDVCGALLCFIRGVPAGRAPAWMRYPTPADLADCVSDLGMNCAAARCVAVRLCQICDIESPDHAWTFLGEIIGSMA